MWRLNEGQVSHYIKLRPNVANETLIFFSLASESKYSYDKPRIFSKALMRHEIDSSAITSLCFDLSLISNIKFVSSWLNANPDRNQIEYR